MGDLIVFRRQVDSVARDMTTNRRFGPPEGRDRPGVVEPEFARSSQSRSPASRTVPDAVKREALKRFLRSAPKVGAHADLDAYVLVLLADQEFTAGRDEQAQSLLDAAYSAFDRETDSQSGGLENRR